MTHTYRLKPDAYKKLQRRSIFVSGITFALVTGIFLYINSGSRAATGMSFTIVMAVAIVVVVFRYIRSTKRQREALAAYELTIDDTELSCRQYGRPPVTMTFNGIVSVIKYNDGLAIKGIDPGSVIIVPASLEDFESFEAQIAAVIPFSQPDKRFFKRYGVTIMAFTMFILLGIFSVVQNDTVNIISGVLLLALLTRSIFFLRKYPAASRSRITIILITIAVAIALADKLTGFSHFLYTK